MLNKIISFFRNLKRPKYELLHLVTDVWSELKEQEPDLTDKIYLITIDKTGKKVTLSKFRAGLFPTSELQISIDSFRDVEDLKVILFNFAYPADERTFECESCSSDTLYIESFSLADGRHICESCFNKENA